MTAFFIHHKDPFRPNLNRDCKPIKSGSKVKHVLKAKGLIREGKRTTPYVVMVGGDVLMRRQWNRRIREGEVVSVCTLPRGGGGGSNVLRIVAMIALIVVSVYFPPAAGLSGALAAGAQAAIMIGGTLLLNMAFPPDGVKTAGVQSREAASPTYSLQAQGNAARLMEAIPVLYGRERLYPDFAASPYSEVAGADEYLYQLFCITQGECNIEKIQIGDTDIGNYEGVQYQIVNPNQQLTLFPGNVVTSLDVSNLQMKGTNEAGYAVLGPFVINAANTSCNSIGVDISLPSGVFHVNDRGDYENATVSYQFEYQAIDNAGAAIGPWTVFASNTISSNSNDPIRLNHKVDVTPGRYQVRGARTNTIVNDTRTQETLYWNTLRAYIVDDNNYGNVTLLAVIMKATNQLSSQNSRKINVIATRKLPVWNPVEGWSASAVPTRNPAWAFADVIRNAEYGRNLPTSRLNIDELYRLSGVWDTRGDTFNFVFDTTTQLWDALTKIAKVGRAMPIYQAGVIDIVRNEPQSLPVGMFQPQNIIANSFNSVYQFADVDTPDYVIIEYRSDTSWQPDEVECVLPGGTQVNPARIQLPGVTNRDQAWREGITMAAANKYQRRTINISTDEAGLIPRYGDLCQISHDVPQWGYSGRVEAFNRTTGVVTASEPFVFDAGSPTHNIAFRRRDGSADGPYTCVAVSGQPYQCQLTGTTQAQRDAIYISDGINRDFTAYQFGPASREGLKVIALTVTPDSDGTVQLGFTNYSPEVFAAETGGVIPNPGTPSNLPKPPQAPVIDDINLEYTFTVGQQTIVATPANGAQYYEFRVSSDGGQNWIRLGTSDVPNINVALSAGSWMISARGVGVIAGAWTTKTVTVEATTLPFCELAALTASTDQVFQIALAFALKPNNGGIAESIELWHGLTNVLGNAVKLATLPATATSYIHTDIAAGETHWYWGRVIDKAGRAGPFFNSSVGIVGQGSSDAGQILDYLTGQITETQLAAALLDRIETGEAAAVEVDTITTELAAMYTIKTQLTVDGRTYVAGIGVGVENNEGIIESQVLVAATRFAVLDPNTSSSARIPFIIQGGVVYMDEAFIRAGTIDNAKIGNVIQSNAVNGSTGLPVWRINKSGSIEFNGTGSDRLTIDSNAMKVIAGGVTRVQVGNLDV